MKKRIMRGLVQSVILLVGITFLSFLLSWLSPGDAAERMLKKSGMMVTEEQLEAKREELGLNKPLLIQYKDWMINLCKGDLGTSYKSKKEVAAELAKNLPYTAALTAVSMLLVVLISLPIGILCAKYRNGLFDNIWRGITYLFSSLFLYCPYFDVCFCIKAGSASSNCNQGLERNPDAGAGTGTDTGCLVYPAGKSYCFKRNVKRIY